MDTPQESYEDRLWKKFQGNAEYRGTEGDHIPLKGDMRFHYTSGRSPEYVMDLMSVIRVPSKAFQIARMSISSDLLNWNGIEDSDVVTTHNKEPIDRNIDHPHRVFVDIDLSSLKNLWARLLPPRPGSKLHTIRTIDDLIRHPKFQQACLMADIEKVETANVILDLTQFKSLAMDKNVPKGPAQAALTL